jgi:sucrose-6F-phosphate phosphohydrolase
MTVDDKFMIVSDMDGTLLGDETALAEFFQWLAPRREQFQLVYNSGRFPDSVRKSIEKGGLLEPDALIGGVGTQIEIFDTREALEDWPPSFDGHWDAQLVRQVLADEPRLRKQPEKFLSDLKVSYFADNATSEELTNWHLKLQTAGLRTRMVYSSHKDLDFLPERCDKGTATAHLANYWGFAPNHVIACGDTANDSALFTQGFLGVIVGNALDELKMLDSPNIYHAVGHHAAGVQEGVIYWVTKAKEANQSPSLAGRS